MDFAEISGILAVTLATVWAIYLLFFAKEKQTLVTAGRHNFEKGDIVAIGGVEYKVLEVTSPTTITVKER